jgi:hypothetical protein
LLSCTDAKGQMRSVGDVMWLLVSHSFYVTMTGKKVPVQ